MQIFPNPANDKLTIQTDLDAYNTFTITNAIGQEIMQQPLNLSQTSVDISKLSAGIYNITFRGAKGVYVQKFVKM